MSVGTGALGKHVYEEKNVCTYADHTLPQQYVYNKEILSKHLLPRGSENGDCKSTATIRCTPRITTYIRGLACRVLCGATLLQRHLLGVLVTHMIYIELCNTRYLSLVITVCVRH